MSHIKISDCIFCISYLLSIQAVRIITYSNIYETHKIYLPKWPKTTNVVFLMAWILVFMKCESKLCAISLRATSRSSFRFSSHCWQRLKETDETSIAYKIIQQNVHHPRKYQVFFFVVYLIRNCGKENKEVWHKWRMLIQIEIQKKTWAIFIF